MEPGKIRNTKRAILHCATTFFLEKGYTAAYITTIAKELEISTGNLTFYFPTKEHLLAELVKELCEFQWELMEKEVGEGNSSLLAYLLELVTIAAACDEDPVMKDFFVSAYIHPLSLAIIRENDTQKTMQVFKEYCQGWTETDYIQAENVVSGIEYAMLMSENTDKLSLEQRIASSLDTILKIYELPKELREMKINKVFAMDYKKLAQSVMKDFCKYVGEQNVEELQESTE